MTERICLYCRGPLPGYAAVGYCSDECEREDTERLTAELDARLRPAPDTDGDPARRNDDLYDVQPPMKRPEKEDRER